ncbi:MAG: hypothetical protein CVV02_00440 [Firmicutes bacterium HGW-Firmicutes-7]|nr:MAG: hypothetical protein CVV02_00440 [Firmicutes bacterium HGW-Firmicutes-7]
MSKIDKDKLKIIHRIKDQELTPEEGFKLIMELDNHSQLITYQQEWLEKDIESIGSGNFLQGTTIIFDTDQALMELMSGYFRENNSTSRVILVLKGSSYKKMAINEYEINPHSQNDYSELISDLKGEGVIPQNILHFWSKHDLNLKKDEKLLEEALTESLFSIFYITKEMMKLKPESKINMLYLFKGDIVETQPQYAGIGGFLKTLKIENPHFNCKSISLKEIHNRSAVIEIILDEMKEIDFGETEVFYNKFFKRHVRSYKEYNQITENLKLTKLKDQGVYVITGGAGEIGLIFAKYLVSQVKCKVVLTGRADLSEEKREKIKELEEEGSEITYLKADISNRVDVQRIIAEIKERFNEINGIIHSAGVLRDAFLFKKTKEELDLVIASKVFGTTYIDEVTKKEKLDFFVCFSSIAATLGNIGQADYAYANSFMDYFAMRRAHYVVKNKRFGKTISINWPLWKNGGMEIDVETIDWLKENKGFVPLSNNNGLLAFQVALASSLNQLIVFEGKKEKIRKIFSITDQGIRRSKDFNIEEDKVSLEVIREHTLQFLKSLISIETKIPISKIKEEDDFEKFGLDSVMVMSLNRQLEKELGALTKTLFYENNTLGELSSYLVNNYKDQVVEKFQPFQSETKDRVTLVEAKVHELEELPRKRFIKSKTETLTEIVIEDNNTNKEEIAENDVAIIGLSGRYPMAENLNEFWFNLTQGMDCITEIPKERWDYKDYFDSEKGKKGKSYSKWGGFIDNVDKFDPLFFNISPRDAKYIDPQERLFLQTVWHTLEDSGYTRARLSKEDVGVFVGVMFGHYQLYGPEMSSSHASIANRVSYYLNLNGPSIGLDTMCSSSLTAIHLAIESIKRGECAAAIAGGVNLTLHPNKYILLSQNNFPSTDGKCRSFGEGGDGYVPGEGTGALLLKPLNKAVAERDRIYGVIKGSAINHGGKTTGYSVPNPNAQAALLSSVFKKSGIDPRTLSYIEAHGTGTALGDPIEIAGLVKAFSAFTKDKGFCSIGSVKSNIGHLESAAGIAGITKLLLQMKNKCLVPSLHSKELNKNITFEETPFFVQQTLEEWKEVEIEGVKYPRRGGVSSFGAGGSNAHIIIEEYIKVDEPKTISNFEPQIFILSAKNRNRLKQYAKEMIGFLENSEDSIEDICYTLQFGREEMDERLAIIGRYKEIIIDKLERFISDEINVDELFTGNIKDQKEEETIFNENSKLDYLNLARSWVNGSHVDWHICHKGSNKQIISMPGYPFAMESYWVENQIEGFAKELNPLKNNSEFGYDEYNVENNETSPITNEIMYLKRVWQQAQIEQPFREESDLDYILVFEDKNKRILERDTTIKDQLIIITEGQEYEEIDAFEYKLNPRRQEDYVRLFNRIQESNIVIGTIINLWTYNSKPYADDELQLDDDFIYGITHLVNTVKTIDHLKIHTIRKIFNLVSIGAYPTNPLFESLQGFNRSIKLIMPNLEMSWIGLDESTKMPKVIMEQINAAPSLDQEIIYRNNKKYICKIEEVQIDEDESVIKNNGVYLITGGAGGLGLVFVKHLTEKYSARIIITGRSPLKGEKEKRINEFLAKGHEVIYMQSDVGNYEEMKRVIRDIKSRFGILNGVIHGAGFMEDKTILEKDIQAFNGSLWPKIQGTIVLDRVTKAEQLDFFVMFSSISAVLGDFGQCDYAVGNKYLDAYVNIREELRLKGKRKGKTISMQWPLWREGGMHLDAEGEALYLQTSGMSYLETQAGIEAFDKILKGRASTVMVIAGHKEKVERFLGISKKTLKADAKDLYTKSIIQVVAEDIKLDSIEKVERALQAEASKILCIDPNLMDINENLGNFGFDSVSLKEYSDKISFIFGIELQPTVFFAYSTIKSLTVHLLDKFGELVKGGETEVSNYEVENQPDKVIENIKPDSSSLDYIELIVEPVAIIGVSGIYPGAKDINELWNNLVEEKDMITEIPQERWDYRDYFGEEATADHKINTKWGGFIEDANKFDPKFFNISPREAELMDPQHRLFLQTVWKTIEDAGYKPSSLSGRNVGVFTGVQFTDYMDMLVGSDKVHPQAGTGNSHAVLCNRVSYLLNFKGPSEAIDTACSSSLVAIHRAVKSIQNGESELAVAGGVTVMASPETFLGTARLGVLSADGRCKTFDKSANGYVRGEGVGAILLKPLSKAIEDKDHIYAVIKGSAEGHGGRANSLTAPNSEAQADLLVKAYEAAGIDPSTVTYIEAHGTGTQLGDPVEIQGLKKAFSDLEKKSGKATVRTNYCGISSIKTNIGHLEPASGIAGITKVILAMKNKKLPGTLHFKEINPYIEIAHSPFYIVENTKDWDQLLDEKGKLINRIAGVSSFGFGGANAHIIVEEYIAPQENSIEAEEPHIIVVSAKNEERLKEYVSEIVKYVEAQEKRGSTDIKSNRLLKEIAYTLQEGREAMAHRIAVVVMSFDELIIKFKDYLEGKGEIEHLYLGTVLGSKQKSDKLVDGVEGEQFISALIRNRKLDKVAQLWVCGGEVDLSLLFKDEKIRKMSLPTYPFGKDIYWIPKSSKSEGDKTFSSIDEKKLHPMIGKNTSTLAQQNFTTILTGKEFFLEDHILGGNKVLPGVAYVEMAREAGALSGTININKVKDIVWTRPIVVDEPREVNISLFQEDDFVAYEISTLDSKQCSVVHGQGKLYEQSRKIPSSSDNKMSIEDIKERCNKVLSNEVCYEIFSQCGLDYGKAFRSISTLFIGEREVLAVLNLQEDLTECMHDYVLHPSIMDGALQGAMGLNYTAHNNETYMPFSINEIEIYGALKKKCFAYITKDEATSKLLKYNILILDEEGNILIGIKALSLRAIASQSAADYTKEGFKSSILYFRNKWEEKEMPLIQQLDRSTKLLLFHNKVEGAKALEGYLKNSYEQPIVVTRGVKFKQLSGHQYEIDDSKVKDYNVLFQALKEHKQMPSHIIHLLSSNNEEPSEGKLDTSIYSIFNLSRSLAIQKPAEKVNILYAYDHENEYLRPYHTAVGGFLKTLSLENSKIAFKLVGLNTKESITSILALEMNSIDTEVIYKKNKRSVKIIEEIKDIEKIEDNTISIREKGVYIITGGAGGLGLLFAEYIAKNYRANVIISGRSELNSNKKERLLKLASYGGEATYLQSDVTNRQEVEKLIGQVKSKYKQINGIIHCAGVIKDAYLINKSEVEMEEVFGPKVYGTTYLDQATKNENLDFFAMFSSVSAIVGNLGQADYAYANSFMDHYAIYRSEKMKLKSRHGKSICINWPLWRDGGMKVDRYVERMLEDRMGMKLLDTENGLEAFKISLKMNGSQFIVAQGSRSGILDAFISSKEKAINEQLKEGQQPTLVVNEEELMIKIQKDLKKTVSEILKIQENEIDLDADLSEFGFDSISFTAFSNGLNEKYKLQLMPSVFYEYSTLFSFTTHLLNEYQEIFMKYYEDGFKATEIVGTKKEEVFNKEKRARSRGHLSKPFLMDEFIEKEKEPVAIIGISGIMPQSDNLEDFWDSLEKGEDLIREIPIDRWDHREIFGSPKWGGFMKEVDKFDPLFFGISPMEAELMDPQQRIFLQTVWKTIEDAGYKSKDISDTNTGIFVGVGTSDYNELLKEKGVEIQAQTSTGISHSILANRISFILNLHGPSEPVDTACSSALVAVHRAVEAIQLGNCNMAIAGGINVIASPTLYISFSKAGMLCEDGRCKTFDKDANGYVRGEGAGAVLLKPLSKAIEDSDHIYAVIKGSAVNHGGHVNSLTTPNPNAQADLIIKAWKNADVNPSTIGYIEAHGTGTSLGDPIEINGLKKAFDQLYKEWGISCLEQHCGVGSVKSNVGHLETASGMAGLLKVILSMKNKTIPASINLKEVSPYIKLAGSPFYIVKSTRNWEKIGEAPRRAGVSSFGFGGTNAHIALEEYLEPDITKEEVNEPQIIVLSAKNEKRLEIYVKELIQFLGRACLNDEGELQSMLQSIKNDLKELASDIINVPVNEINSTEMMNEYGFDPINLTRFYDGVYKKFEIDISAKISSGYASLESIGKELVAEYSDQLKSYYPKGTMQKVRSISTISLTDMAYTLQVGRDAMMERLAVVVNSIEELKDKLKQYLEGNKVIDNLFIGKAIENKQKPLQLIEGEEGEEFIKHLLQNGKTNKIAQLWASGGEVDWRQIKRGGSKKRLSLPTYPFARDRYWVPEPDEIKLLKVQKENNKLHPMIDKNVSTFKEQKFLTEFTGKEFYFEDHIIRGNKILPGVVYLEIARAAGELSCDEKVIRIKDIVWIKPIIEGEMGTKVNIQLVPKNKHVDFEITSIDQEKKSILYGQGKLVFESKHKEKEENLVNQVVDILAIKDRCNKNIHGEVLYKSFVEDGFDYGRSFQTITDFYSNHSEALSLLKLPEQLSKHFSEFILHPSLMDGALQTVAGIGKEDQATYLPFSIGEIEIIGNLVEECYVYAILAENQGKVKKYKVEILDRLGNVLIRIKDFSLRALVKKESEKTIKAVPETIYYNVFWERTPLDNKLKVKHEGKKLLVFDWDTKHFDSIKKQGMVENNKLILVSEGATFKKISSEKYEIDFNDRTNYKKLIEDLNENGNMPTHILHLLNVRNQEKFKDHYKELCYELETSLYAMFHLSGSLIEGRSKEKVKIIYVYSSDIDKANPHYQGMSGFLKTVALESSSIEFNMIELESESELELELDTKKCEEVANIVISELEESLEVKYKEGQRWIKSNKEIKTIDKTVDNGDLMKDQGVYIITGGTGGLGLIFAEHIAKNYCGTIVLSGRKALDLKTRQALKRLNSFSSEVVYIKANVLVKEEVDNLVCETKTRFGGINGIIHCAGIVKDAYIVNKTLEEMQEVIGPKIFGTIWLDEATKEEKLDFFMLFSSIAGVFGNSGQADYAYANCFMDNYARKRENLVVQGFRQGKTVSINWPLWKAGGMKVDSTTEKMLETTMGLTLLDLKTGIDAFSFGLTLEQSQLIVVNGYRNKMNQGSYKDIENKQFEKEKVLVDAEGLSLKVQEDLLEVVSKILKLQKDELDLDGDLSEFGFDSITFTDFSNQLNEKYEINIMPSIFYEYSTLASFVKFVVGQYNKAISSYYNQTVSSAKIVFDEEDFNNTKPMINTPSRFINNIETSKIEPVAVIGMSGIMPQSENLEVFWDHLEAEKNLITEIPPDRWDWKEIYGNPMREANKTNIIWGGFMKEVDKFDPLFFGISPREAELMDPQQRIFLETVWRTIEDAGYKSSDISGTKTGVFVGVGTSDYNDILKDCNIEIQAQTATGMAHCVLANRISYLLNLHGPSEPIDTACSSSLVAIHRAIEAIQYGNCSMAIAGGINVIASPALYISFSKAGMLCEDGSCKTFDKNANGYVRGEGAGAVLLKPLSKAIEDGDHIYGVIKGSAVNHGGHVNSLTTPNPNAQAELIITAWEKANIDPSTVGYIEAHGTGTSIGDPIEINGLKKAFNVLNSKWGNSIETPYCALGSVKTNIGHLETAAGISGLLKVLLALKYKKIPASINFNELNPYIQLTESPFYIAKRTEQWEKIGAAPRRAGVSSFGFGGTNAHIVIEEYEEHKGHFELINKEPLIILLSAKNKDCLVNYAREMMIFIERKQQRNESLRINDISYTSIHGRDFMEERLSIIAASIEELRRKLESFVDKDTNMDGVFTGNIRGEKKQQHKTKEKQVLDLNQTAKQWVQGEEIDWRSVYNVETSSKISLPTYPFSRERHWVTKKASEEGLQFEEPSSYASELEILRALEAGEIGFEDALLLMEEDLYE